MQCPLPSILCWWKSMTIATKILQLHKSIFGAAWHCIAFDVSLHDWNTEINSRTRFVLNFPQPAPFALLEVTSLQRKMITQQLMHRTLPKVQWWEFFLRFPFALLEVPSCRGKCPGRAEPDRSHRTGGATRSNQSHNFSSTLENTRKH